MRCFCSCIWGNPDPGPVRLRDVQQVVLDTNRMGTVVSVCLPVMLVCVCILSSYWGYIKTSTLASCLLVSDISHWHVASVTRF